MREPHAAVVYLFRRRPEGVGYAVLQRADDGNWQGVSGGVETGETPADAARRETREETGLGATAPLYRLDMTSGVEKIWFAAAAGWPADLYIVVKHFFGMHVTAEPGEVVLSAEHRAMRWLENDAACQALRYDDDRTALWELHARLAAADLPAPEHRAGL